MNSFTGIVFYIRFLKIYFKIIFFRFFLRSVFQDRFPRIFFLETAFFRGHAVVGIHQALNLKNAPGGFSPSVSDEHCFG